MSYYFVIGIFIDTFGTVCSHVGMNVTVSEVSQIVKDLHNGKSSGLDG